MAKAKKASLRPLLKNIIFVFEDELATMMGVKQFKEETNWGFQLGASYDHNIKQARWSIVIAVGPDVHEDLTPGTRIMVEPLKWTEGVKFEDNLYWMTNEDHVILVDD